LKERIIILIKGVLFVFLAACNFSQASLLEDIPLNSWVYPTVDELYVQGFFPELHKNVKPYARGEIASFLIQIEEMIKNKELIPTPSQVCFEIQALSLSLPYSEQN
jgi:hypothetical protein